MRFEFRDDLAKVVIAKLDHCKILFGLHGHPVFLFLDEQKGQGKDEPDKQRRWLWPKG
jgi:hypothetical protein